jgi:hypothetical protein
VLSRSSRVALAYYVIRRLNLDLTEYNIPPEIVLTNAAEFAKGEASGSPS